MPSNDRDLRNLAIAAWSLGWTVPILEILGRTPTFFVARELGWVGSIVVLTIVAGAPAAVFRGVRWLPVRTRRWIWRAAAAFGFGVILIRASGFTESPGTILAMLGIGPVLGWAISDVGLRKGWLTEWARVLAWAPIAFVLVVVGFYPLSQSLRVASAVASPAATAEEPLVIVVIFDEMPLASLVGASGNIRPWYPAFRELTSDSVWFRNAVTVHGFTEQSVPAILSGVVTDPTQGGDATPDTPGPQKTIFSISQWESGVDAMEPVTNLCVFEHCNEIAGRAPWPRATAMLARDLTGVALRSVLPEAARRSPAFSDENFVWNARSDRRIAVKQAIESLQTSPSRLFVFHLLVPHSPFQYDATGRELIPYSEAIGVFNGDDAATLQAHLLQVGYADSVLRDIVAGLKARGLYDEALLAVVADHGISFRGTSSSRRELAEGSVGDIGFVPMFVKLPGGDRAGEISDFPAMTVDLLPTIAGAVGLPVPWHVDGVDLLGDRLPDAASRRAIPGLEIQRDFGEVLEVANWIDGFFPSGDLRRFVPFGQADLVGQPTGVVGIASGITWRELDPAPRPAGNQGDVVAIRGQLVGDIPTKSTLVVISDDMVVAHSVLPPTSSGRFLAIAENGRLGDTLELALVGADGSFSHIARQSPRWPKFILPSWATAAPAYLPIP
jgi:hypothetical protein